MLNFPSIRIEFPTDIPHLYKCTHCIVHRRIKTKEARTRYEHRVSAKRNTTHYLCSVRYLHIRREQLQDSGYRPMQPVQSLKIPEQCYIRYFREHRRYVVLPIQKLPIKPTGALLSSFDGCTRFYRQNLPGHNRSTR